MATIGNIIRQLLEERKKVILPGFGNLEIQESGGSFPTSGKRIDPPGLKVLFDSSFSKDDGLLASAMAEGEQISQEEAGQQVLELVDAIKFALDKGEPYSLEDAGSFRRDDDGKVRFQPEPGWVLEPDQYGLESMELLELEDLPDEEAGTQETVEETVAAEDHPAGDAEKQADPEEAKEPSPPSPPPPPPTSRPSPPVHEPWKQEKEKPRRRISNSWRIIWIVAGVLIVVLVVLILVPTERFDILGSRGETEQPVTGEGETVDPGAGEPAGETVEAPVTGNEEEAGGEEQPVVEQEVPQPVEEFVVADNFFIIAGSFKHLGNASELQDKLKAMGYQAEVMVTENRMYRVSVASYATRAEAERGLAQIRSVQALKACWLLSN